MGFFTKLYYGFDPDEDQRRGDEADAKLRELNQREYAPGGSIYERISAERGPVAADATLADVLEHLDTSDTGNVSDQIRDSFYEGLQEGYDNVTGTISNTLAAPIRFTLASIPWQLWAVGLVALFLYMGGGLWLKNRFAK